MVSRKVTMKDEPNIESRCSTSLVFPVKHEVLSGDTVFHRIGPLFRRMGSLVLSPVLSGDTRVSPDWTSVSLDWIAYLSVVLHRIGHSVSPERTSCFAGLDLADLSVVLWCEDLVFHRIGPRVSPDWIARVITGPLR